MCIRDSSFPRARISLGQTPIPRFPDSLQVDTILTSSTRPLYTLHRIASLSPPSARVRAFSLSVTLGSQSLDFGKGRPTFRAGELSDCQRNVLRARLSGLSEGGLRRAERKGCGRQSAIRLPALLTTARSACCLVARQLDRSNAAHSTHCTAATSRTPPRHARPVPLECQTASSEALDDLHLCTRQ